MSLQTILAMLISPWGRTTDPVTLTPVSKPMANTTPTATEETILQKLDDEAKLAWQKLKDFVDDNVWPVIVDFAHLIISQVEGAEVGQAITIISDLVGGNVAAAAGAAAAAALTTAEANAAADAKAALATSAPLEAGLQAVTEAPGAPSPAAADTNAPDGESTAETEAESTPGYTPPDGSSEPAAS